MSNLADTYRNFERDPIQWAGGYPVPKRSGDYVVAVEKFLCAFKGSDLDVATGHFARVGGKLLADAAKSAHRAEDAFLQSLLSQKSKMRCCKKINGDHRFDD